MSQKLQKITKIDAPCSTDGLNGKTGVHLESRHFNMVIKMLAVGSDSWPLVAQQLSIFRHR